MRKNIFKLHFSATVYGGVQGVGLMTTGGARLAVYLGWGPAQVQKQTLSTNKGLVRVLKRGIVTAHVSEELGQSDNPPPPPHPAMKHLLSSSATCLHIPPPILPKIKKLVQARRMKKAAGRINCPEVSSQARHPLYKQNHPVTTGSLSNPEEGRRGLFSGL